MTKATPTQTASKAGRILNTPVHPEVLKLAKIDAIRHDTTLAEVVHAALCNYLGQSGLAGESPDIPRVALAS